jgi:hypothetical protein
MDALTPADHPFPEFASICSLPRALDAAQGQATLTVTPTLTGFISGRDALHRQVSLLKSRTFRTFRLQAPLTFPIVMFGFRLSGFTA